MATKVFQIADLNIYDELPNITPAGSVSAGDGVFVEDVFGFYLQSIDPTGATFGEKTEGTIIYRCRQVIALKKTGTGESIKAGQKLYYIVASGKVSPNKSGSYGTDYYFCGWAKLPAASADTTVEMNFDGTRGKENI